MMLTLQIRIVQSIKMQLESEDSNLHQKCIGKKIAFLEETSKYHATKQPKKNFYQRFLTSSTFAISKRKFSNVNHNHSRFHWLNYTEHTIEWLQNI